MGDESTGTGQEIREVPYRRVIFFNKSNQPATVQGTTTIWPQGSPGVPPTFSQTAVAPGQNVSTTIQVGGSIPQNVLDLRVDLQVGGKACVGDRLAAPAGQAIQNAVFVIEDSGPDIVVFRWLTHEPLAGGAVTSTHHGVKIH